MQIGKDAMGTMANTLILAFAGSSLNMLILVQTYNIPFLPAHQYGFYCSGSGTERGRLYWHPADRSSRGFNQRKAYGAQKKSGSLI